MSVCVAAVVVVFEVEISSRTLIPLFRPESLQDHSTEAQRAETTVAECP